MADDLLSTFRPAFEAAALAFSEGDLERAVAGLPEDFEWHPLDQDPERAVHHGPDEAKRWWQRLAAIFDEMRVEVSDIEQLDDRTVLTRYLLRGTSGSAGAPVSITVFEIWEFEGIRPVRARQFPSRDEALRAAHGG